MDTKSTVSKLSHVCFIARMIRRAVTFSVSLRDVTKIEHTSASVFLFDNWRSPISPVLRTLDDVLRFGSPVSIVRPGCKSSMRHLRPVQDLVLSIAIFESFSNHPFVDSEYFFAECAPILPFGVRPLRPHQRHSSSHLSAFWEGLSSSRSSYTVSPEPGQRRSK